MNQQIITKEIKIQSPRRTIVAKFQVNWILKWGLILGFWISLGVIYSTQLYVGMYREGRDNSFVKILSWQLLGTWLVWFLFTPLILRIGQKFPLEISSWKRTLMANLGMVGLLTVVHSITLSFATVLISPFSEGRDNRTFPEMLWTNLLGGMHLELLVYVMILGTGYAADYYNRFREREYRAAQLETQLARSQIQMLKMQLHPHFLFNTINGIVGLVRDNKNNAAVNMLVGLSDLLRNTLQNSGKQEVPLSEELDFLELYLDLEQMRFSDRLKIEMDIAPETMEARVPNLLLQPLVENSIRHGIAKSLNSGLIKITSWVENEVLYIKVYDDGPGLPDNWRPEESDGIGLSNTRERLRQLYGAQYDFRLSNREEGGIDVILSLPLSYQDMKN